MLGKSSMVFALGIYLPLGLTSPVLAGGIMSHLINKRSDKTGGEQGGRIRERGVIIASGLMAGGALGGVLGASLRLFPWYREDLIQTPFYLNDPSRNRFPRCCLWPLLYVWFYSVKKEKV
jgi:membrane associated rhomboid family serine protease